MVSLRSKVNLGLGVALGIVLAVGAATHFSIIGLISTARSVIELGYSLNLLSTLYGTIRDSEVASRSFVLTGDPRHLKPYQEAVSSIPAMLAELKSDAGSDAVQQSAVVSLERAIQKRITSMEEGMQERRDSRLTETSLSVQAARGQEEMHEISMIVRRLRMRWDGEQDRLAMEVRERSQNTGTILIIGEIVTFLFIGFLLFGLNRDLAERRRAEEALQESEESHRSLIQNATYGIYRCDSAGNLIEVNDALVNMLGYESQAELLAMNLAADIYRNPIDRDLLIERYVRQEKVEGVEVEWKRKDGTSIRVRLSGRNVRDPRGEIRGSEIIVENVHERRVLEEQLRQAQKMEAVGRLAGGIAKDFGRHLGTVADACQTLKKSVQPEDPNFATLLSIENAADQAEVLTRQLVAVGRQETVERTEIDLKPLILTMKRTLQLSVGKNIEILTDLEPHSSRVRVDIGQMEQVILNLVFNSRDALPDGGKIMIETLNVEINVNYARYNVGIEAGPYLLLTITHNGIGFDPSSWSRVFEPFSMASRLGRGRGMELATVYGIVKQSSGEIEIYSDVDLGSTFVVYLPRVSVGSATPPVPVDPASMPTVLLLEEERMIRALARNILLMHGFNVLEATRLDEALTLCKRYGRPIHLMVTDVVMPEMMGRELVARVSQIQPDLRVLYTTGYTDEDMDARSASAGSAMIEKPFAPGLFIRKVQELLRKETGVRFR